MTIEERLRPLIEQYVKAVPTPPGFTSREIVRRAIEFDDPPRIPYSFVEPLASDFTELGGVVAVTGTLNMYTVPKGEMVFDKWGVGWTSTGRAAWGHADVCPLANLDALESYRFPDAVEPEQIAAAKVLAEAGNAAGKYVVGADPIDSFERLRSLMGFDNMMVNMYADRERFEKVYDKLTDMTVEMVSLYAETGNVHGFMTWDDWGLQTSLQIKPAYWRDLFKPRYARIIKACHNAGMHYFLHSCGDIWDIIDDLIEIGCDVLQIDQPRLLDVDKTARAFGGRIAFWDCVDIQWSTSKDANLEEVLLEPVRMIEAFRPYKGGFIARQYPQPRDIEMSPERHRAIAEAFFEAGCR